MTSPIKSCFQIFDNSGQGIVAEVERAPFFTLFFTRLNAPQRWNRAGKTIAAEGNDFIAVNIFFVLGGQKLLPAFFENVFFPKCFGSRPHSQKMSETALGLVTENGRKNPESQNFDEVFFQYFGRARHRRVKSMGVTFQIHCISFKNKASGR